MTLEEQKVLYSAVDKLTSTENHVLKEEGDKFKKKIPGLGGKPFTIIIVASWRTGSTFLAQLVASGLKNMRFFIYEPLMAKVSKCHYSGNPHKIGTNFYIEMMRKIFFVMFSNAARNENYEKNMWFL